MCATDNSVLVSIYDRVRFNIKDLLRTIDLRLSGKVSSAEDKAKRVKE